ncbi:nitrilase-related carbon-nitrogen hydrolase [Cyanobium sp. ATX-6F1]|uniref:nitrilase-related carbon-nitrogen hydrolase n=1 Tax=Cyanobium sp. ATX-6F1 TaxID=3137388 RepID=UPI0039BDC6B5
MGGAFGRGRRDAGVPSRLLAAQGNGPVGAVGVAICYELSDGAALAGAVRGGAGWLLASANLDPYPAQLQEQFVALARLRAIETGRWLVSSANTGPSLVVDAQGRVRSRLAPGRARTGVMELQPLGGLTPYDRWGDAPLLLLLAGALLVRALLVRAHAHGERAHPVADGVGIVDETGR